MGIHVNCVRCIQCLRIQHSDRVPYHCLEQDKWPEYQLLRLLPPRPFGSQRRTTTADELYSIRVSVMSINSGQNGGQDDDANVESVHVLDVAPKVKVEESETSQGSRDEFHGKNSIRNSGLTVWNLTVESVVELEKKFCEA